MDAVHKNSLVYDHMPVDLVIVGHGENEGSILHRRSPPAPVADRQRSEFRLTQKGRLQAKAAGDFIKSEIGPFDFHFCSEYVRTMESAASLELPNACWTTDFYIRERDFGIVGMDKEETDRLYPEEERRRAINDFFFYQAPGAESVANTVVRVDQFLQKIAYRCSGMRVIVVCHPGLTYTFRLLLERTMSPEFEEEWNKRTDTVSTCNILHYSRRDPDTGVIHTHLKWMRSVDPLKVRTPHPWQEIIPTSFTNSELRELADKTPLLVDNSTEEIEDFWRLYQKPTTNSDRVIDMPPAVYIEKNSLEYENMPVDLIIIRHGESEGNLLKLRNGRSRDHIDEGTPRSPTPNTLLADRPSSDYRLTQKGRIQSQHAGNYIKTHVGTVDFHFCSEYLRTLETAAELGLPDACWTTDFFIRSGFRDKTRAPPEGPQDLTGDESIGHACLRVDKFIRKLANRCGGMRVVVVCHHGISYTFRLLLERTMRPEFVAEVKNASNPIGNGYILHYTRRHPETGVIHRHLNWMRSIDPMEQGDLPPWEPIMRPTFSNDQLRQRVELTRQLVDNTPEEVERYVVEHPNSS
ncbi:phosphoglycerate mutase family protein [Pelomyxa schiedti]|nr:phosphoglycerate mutase family protein [Pelomyxa schiedti]